MVWLQCQALVNKIARLVKRTGCEALAGPKVVNRQAAAVEERCVRAASQSALEQLDRGGKLASFTQLHDPPLMDVYVIRFKRGILRINHAGFGKQLGSFGKVVSSAGRDGGVVQAREQVLASVAVLGIKLHARAQRRKRLRELPLYQ